MSGDPAGMAACGWTLYAHPMFLDQLGDLVEAVEVLRSKDPKGYKTKNATKRLAAIHKLTFENIPTDPSQPAYRQGSTLGDHNKHWFRAKFFQQYRLFFRYDTRAKVIIYAWVNDDKTLRAYNSKTDAYRVFKGMLEDGNPPSDFDALLKEARGASGGLEQVLGVK